MTHLKWHLLVFIAIELYLIIKLAIRNADDDNSYYAFDLMPTFLVVLIIMVALIYGGIAWW